ncbi:DoxX family protein [Lacibacter luteus]|uniref:DoxX family protein n=1 Tax=Lacibacter luteus TaxID=2508719 RepID=A0A4Q1CEP0_9BACT|nr:DoxX family protein [Lacibacter luteus]RXK58281.1 DoxX family protein [Lacibacter luteus]
MNFQNIFSWVLRLLAALIMLQTLYYKFSANEESVYIFSEIGMEPWGRIGTGVMELIASVLLLYPRTTHLGALLGVGLMGGALFFHITKLGVEVKGDGGLLFVYALLVMMSCLLLLYFHRNKISELLTKFKTK